MINCLVFIWILPHVSECIAKADFFLVKLVPWGRSTACVNFDELGDAVTTCTSCKCSSAEGPAAAEACRAACSRVGAGMLLLRDGEVAHGEVGRSRAGMLLRDGEVAHGEVGRSRAGTLLCDGEVGRSRGGPLFHDGEVGWSRGGTLFHDGEVGRSRADTLLCDGEVGRSRGGTLYRDGGVGRSGAWPGRQPRDRQGRRVTQRCAPLRLPVGAAQR